MSKVAILSAVAALFLFVPISNGQKRRKVPVSKRHQPKLLLGSWSGSGGGGRGPRGQRRMGWTKKYTMRADGTYTMTGYPPIRVDGHWYVTKRTGKRFKLRLVHRRMRASRHDTPSRWPDHSEWVILKKGKLHWQKAVFYRSR